jgi:putative Holliday junction resolvase
MRILGIDYGRKKMGISLATSSLAEPYGLVRAGSSEEAIDKIGAIAKKEGVDKIVVGVSEGQMAEESKGFSKNLKERLGLNVETFDETLSTQEAQRLAIQAGVRKGKRKKLEDAYAACVMLQLFIDSQS